MKFSPFGRGERQAKRMNRMMDKLDVDVVALAESHGGQGFAEARHECQRCGKTGTCEAWLDGKAGDANPYAFCPNAAEFDDTKRG